MKQIFFGPNGLRAGWRVLLFLALFGGVFFSFVLIKTGGPQGLHALYQRQAHITITPMLMAGSEAIQLLFLGIAAFVMSRIERRNVREYGLPVRQAFGKEFWTGSSIGFLAISGTQLAMFLLHGFRITGLALHGTAIISSLAGWGLAFLLAGLVEEFLFRGYIQHALTTGIGFWPAAFLMSGLFGLGHYFNANETVLGSLAVVLFGLLLCLFLRRTGNLWCAVGFHLGYDWGQMFFGVRDSGIVPYHHLLNSTSHGPQWLTGGIVGPEASVLTPIALLIVALIFSRKHPDVRYKIEPAQESRMDNSLGTSPLLQHS